MNSFNDPNVKAEEVKEPAEQATEIEQVPGEEKESAEEGTTED